MSKTNYEKKLEEVLNKFDFKNAISVLDILADAEDEGHNTTKKENNLRERLLKCLETYERTMYLIEGKN